jgi:hypothetical protein
MLKNMFLLGVGMVLVWYWYGIDMEQVYRPVFILIQKYGVYGLCFGYWRLLLLVAAVCVARNIISSCLFVKEKQ